MSSINVKTAAPCVDSGTVAGRSFHCIAIELTDTGKQPYIVRTERNTESLHTGILQPIERVYNEPDNDSADTAYLAPVTGETAYLEPVDNSND